MRKIRLSLNRALCLLFCCLFIVAAAACGGDKPAAVTVGISAAKVSVEEGKTVTLSAIASDGSAIVWSSGDENVAAVKDGVVTGVSEGKTKITASCARALAVCQVTVLPKSAQPDQPDEPEEPDVPDNPKPNFPDGENYALVFSDEFDGEALNRSNWNYQLGTQDVYHGKVSGPSYWGNNEQQYYTEDAVSVSGGMLKITAEKRREGDRDYTSGRIVTRDLHSFTYGYFEAKMKLPVGTGMWPAFWMLPQPNSFNSTDNDHGGWAANGEIDIMEAKGRLPDKASGTVHYGGNWPQNTYSTNEHTLNGTIDLWHTYAVEWTEDALKWYFDGELILTVTSDTWWTTASKDKSAPFDKPFYILFNLAVGGNFDGGLKPSDDFKSDSMYVDYVRVFAKKAA